MTEKTLGLLVAAQVLIILLLLSSKLNHPDMELKSRPKNLIAISNKVSLWPQKAVTTDRESPKQHYESLVVNNSRVLTQINYAMGLARSSYKGFKKNSKIIFMEDIEKGNTHFKGMKASANQCLPTGTCEITNDRRMIPRASAVVVFDFLENVKLEELGPEQIYVALTMEPPTFYKNYRFKYDPRVWLATYRSDSDIVSRQYVWQYYNDSIRSMEQRQNYAAGKTKKVAAIVSHCWTYNRRFIYIQALSKYIQVDIYGKCGRRLPRKRDVWRKKMSRYKFILAFENSNCRGYITEKVFRNAFEAKAIPIVMGAHPRDYESQLPQNSYILLERFKTAQNLAQYLHFLDHNDAEYNRYFRWRGTGRLLSLHEYFPCVLCAMLYYHEHVERKPEVSRDYKFWRNHLPNNESACRPPPWNFKGVLRGRRVVNFPSDSRVKWS